MRIALSLILILAPLCNLKAQGIPGIGGLGAVAAHGGGASYTGPCDLQTFKVWYGLRACGSVAATNLVASFDWFCSNSGSHSGTVHVASTGDLNATETASIASTCGAAQVQFNKFYDQSGSNACSGPCDAPEIDAGANSYIVNCLGSLPCTQFHVGGGAGFRVATSVAVSQPFTISAVFGRTSGTTSYQVTFDSANDNAFLGNNNAANKARLASNTSEIVPTMSDNAVHAVQGLLNGASSVLSIDNTETTGSPGTASLSGGFCIARQGNGTTGCSGNNPLQGPLMEVGLVASGLSGAARTAMCHNQFAYWGTTASC